jgi:hypothetical protein
VLIRRFHRSVFWQFEKSDFFNRVDRLKSFWRQHHCKLHFDELFILIDRFNDAAERAKKQVRQLSINKAIQDSQRIIDQATADAAADRASADGVQLAADNLARRLAASEASGNFCTAAASKAATRAAAVLADVLKHA